MREEVKPVLEWVNNERARHRCAALSDIPKGLRATADRCPIAQALKDCSPVEYVTVYPSVTNSSIWEYGVYSSIKPWNKDCQAQVPEHVVTFIREFDAGTHPEYEDNA